MRRRYLGLVCACACGLAGCGGPTPVTVSFTSRSRPVVLSVGEHLAARTSAGECGLAQSSNPRVLAPEKPYPSPGTSCPSEVLFTAISTGVTDLSGLEPCSGTGCSPVGVFILVIVTAPQRAASHYQPAAEIVQPRSPVWCFMPSGPEFDARALLGLAQSRAQALADRHHCAARVVEQDGKSVRVNGKLQPDPIDLAIDGGIVTSVATG